MAPGAYNSAGILIISCNKIISCIKLLRKEIQSQQVQSGYMCKHLYFIKSKILSLFCSIWPGF